MWFTQGSGKSLIALFYVCLLRERPELENPTVVIVTDRNDLDGQMFETFAACPVPLRTEPRQAQEVDDLKDMLRNQAAGGVFFTTIQKFRPDEPGKPMEVLCERSNVIVICDEAHCTQYGRKARLDSRIGRMKYGLAKHMREALPNAGYLGLTGTPISEDDKDTQAVFGEYVDLRPRLSFGTRRSFVAFARRAKERRSPGVRTGAKSLVSSARNRPDCAGARCERM